MSEKKIVVPQGMLEAALPFCQHQLHSALEAALLWLSENPIEPTEERVIELARTAQRAGYDRNKCVKAVTDKWQRIMFLAPEPVVPYELKDLLFPYRLDGDAFNAIQEAYRLGVEAGKK